jgi:hypothetical protein
MRQNKSLLLLFFRKEVLSFLNEVEWILTLAEPGAFTLPTASRRAPSLSGA